LRKTKRIKGKAGGGGSLPTINVEEEKKKNIVGEGKGEGPNFAM